MRQAPQTEYKLSGCRVTYREGTISLASDVDPSERFVWTLADAAAAADIFRFLAPELARALRLLASVGRLAMATEHRDNRGAQ